MAKLIDISGQRFGLLTVNKIIGKQPFGNKLTLWECICDCGNTITTIQNSLKRGDTKSCGCLRKGSGAIHGQSNNRFYRIWASMKGRCYYESSPSYPYYGGRGIKICKRWHVFKNFYKDMYPTYEEHLTIERIDVNGDYKKSNTKWIPPNEQSRNKRNTVKVQYKGKLTLLLDLALELNLNRALVLSRLRKGWEIQDAIFTPSKKSSKIYP